jgi:UDP-N-acetylmuramoylalanine--D-glutamate ligase
MIDVRGKRVLVVGLARSGRAVAFCLSRRGAKVTVTDAKPPSAFQDVLPELLAQKVGLELGVHRPESFLRQDLIVVSPGVPWDLPALQQARERGVLIMPEVEVASWYLTNRLVGISGTNGKTTTTALLGRMLEASGLPTFVGGNIGVPLISAVDHASPETLIVAELSSFQLQAIRDFHPHVAVLLNLTPNHLDRHPSFEAYIRAKAMIFRNQTPEDYAVLNADDPRVMDLVPTLTDRHIRKVFFSARQNLPAGVFVSGGRVRYRVRNLERALFATGNVALRGAFNLENVLAATAAACVLGADFEAIKLAVREFKGVEHRLERVREIRGVEFYNDSKATSVDATLKALSTFERGVHLILGGTDKAAPYAPLRPQLKDRVRAVYLIGAAAERIAKELAGAAELISAADLETALRRAFSKAVAGDIVLLSPACSSFDQFKDFEHRGRVFNEIVTRLAEETDKAGVGVRDSGFGRRDDQEPKITGDNAADQNLRPETRISNPDPQPPSPPLLYEVGADELVPHGEFATLEEAEDIALGQDFHVGEILRDEPLLFEIRSASAAPNSVSERSTSSSATPDGEARSSQAMGAAFEGSRSGPGRGKSGQDKLPGLE